MFVLVPRSSHVRRLRKPFAILRYIANLQDDTISSLFPKKFCVMVLKHFIRDKTVFRPVTIDRR